MLPKMQNKRTCKKLMAALWSGMWKLILNKNTKKYGQTCLHWLTFVCWQSDDDDDDDDDYVWSFLKRLPQFCRHDHVTPRFLETLFIFLTKTCLKNHFKGHREIDKVLISPTFYEQLFCTKLLLSSAFLYYEFVFVYIFLSETILAKKLSVKNWCKLQR